MQQPVSEEVPALAISSELRFVERNESEICADRHRLDGTQQIARILGLDPLLAGDQRHLASTFDLADLVIDLARQQPQRKADRA